MKIFYSEKLSEHRYKTPEGYLICVDSILARTGKQTYKRSEIFGDDDERLVEVFVLETVCPEQTPCRCRIDTVLYDVTSHV